MASTSPEVLYDLSPLLRVYKDGRVERLIGESIVPASFDPITGVQSKDVVISPETPLSARLYIPRTAGNDRKLPVLIYFHGGGFACETAFSPTYHNHLNILTAESNAVVVSVDYRRSPENPLPAAYDDSWAAVEWVGSGEEPWIADQADLSRVFFAGDSAGGNIAHRLGIRAGTKGLDRAKLVGTVLIHPFFWGEEPTGSEPVEKSHRALADGLWKLANPNGTGLDDPWINPDLDPNLSAMGCGRVLVCVAEKDTLRDRGWRFSETLRTSGWKGEVEVREDKEDGHVFHLWNPTCDNALGLIKAVASFINEH